jgi:hypothetical protein
MKPSGLLMSSLLLCALWSGLPLTVFGVDRESGEKVNGIVAGNIFQRCAFDFTDTKHISRLSHMSPGHDYRVSGYEDGCDMDLKISGFHTLGDARTWLAIISPTKIDETATSKGFDRSTKSGWTFKGNPMGIYFSKYQNITMKSVRTGGDITLIGRQMESGRDQTGTFGTFEGVHILRITPDFLVSVDLPFAYSTAASTRNSVVSELSKLVKSLYITDDSKCRELADRNRAVKGQMNVGC